jgi:hypothetical protein
MIRDKEMDFITPELIQSLGSASAATLLSIFFIWVFKNHQERQLDKILAEMSGDRETFRDAVEKIGAAVEKIDRRLEIQEILINNLKEQVKSK